MALFTLGTVALPAAPLPVEAPIEQFSDATIAAAADCGARVRAELQIRPQPGEICR